MLEKVAELTGHTVKFKKEHQQLIQSIGGQIKNDGVEADEVFEDIPHGEVMGDAVSAEKIIKGRSLIQFPAKDPKNISVDSTPRWAWWEHKREEEKENRAA